MNIRTTEFPDVYIIEPHIYRDERGYIFETFNLRNIKENIKNFNVIQENQSISKHGVIRGLHYQKPPFTQGKIVQVVKGEVLDIIVDIRTDSPTFSQHMSIILNGTNKLQLYVPRGFAHGFITLSKDAIFQYKIDNLYEPQYECGIRFDDKQLNIDWKMKHNLIVSKKDSILNVFNENTYYTKVEYNNNPYEMPLLK
jgi:dTDP-4-dehydrorhamnose 3,5-epimerase